MASSWTQPAPDTLTPTALSCPQSDALIGEPSARSTGDLPKPLVVFQPLSALLRRAVDIWKQKDRNAINSLLFWVAVLWVAAILVRI